MEAHTPRYRMSHAGHNGAKRDIQQPPPVGHKAGAIYTVAGASAGMVAYNLASLAAHRYRHQSYRTLLADAEGGLSRGQLSGMERKPIDDMICGGLKGDLEGYVMHNAGLTALPHPSNASQPADGLILRLRGEFDLIFVPCGLPCATSQYATDWIKQARRAVVCANSSRSLQQNMTRIGEPRGARGGILLAPMGSFELPEETARLPVFGLPSPRDPAYADPNSAELREAFENLLDGLLDDREPATDEAAAEEPATEQASEPNRRSHEAFHQPGWETQARAVEAAARSSSDTDLSGDQPAGQLPAVPARTEDPGEEDPGAVDSGRNGALANARSSHGTPDTDHTSHTPPIRRDRATLRERTESRPLARTPPNPTEDENTAPTTRLARIRSGISKLSGRLRGRSASGATTADHPDEESREELEQRLKLSLRETTVSGMRRVCIGSPKGGVGKSSIAYAVAGSIAYYTNLRVCLVDTDPNFGSMRLLVPRPIERSVLDLAEDADELNGLSQIRDYVAKNDKMGLDVVLGPKHAHELAQVENLDEAYARVDSVLSRFYDIVVYDLGPGFRDPAIREVLSFSDHLLYVTDSEKVSNAMLTSAVKYLEGLDVGLSRYTTTLTIQHRFARTDESEKVQSLRDSHETLIRPITEIPFDARMSKLLNSRSFDVEDLHAPTRRSVLTTAAACLKGLRENHEQGPVQEGSSPAKAE